jgi:hypothetical protein
MRQSGLTTVNIYSLPLQSWHRTIAQLDGYMANKRVGEYCEAAFRGTGADEALEFDAVFFEEHRWYEVDTAEDLIGFELALSRSPQITPVAFVLQPLAMDPGNIGARRKIAAA